MSKNKPRPKLIKRESNMRMSILSLQRVVVTVVLLFLLSSLTTTTTITTVDAFGIGDATPSTWMNGIFNKQIKINKNQSVTKILFDKLNKLIDESPKNGIDTPPEIEAEIIRIAQVLGK